MTALEAVGQQKYPYVIVGLPQVTFTPSIKNLDVRNGHCKGTGYIILEITNNLIKAERLIGGVNYVILILRILMISKDSSFPVPFK